MSEEAGEKSQEPTPHRRQQVREEGQIARSQDLRSAGMLVGGLGILIFAGAGLVQFLAAFLGQYLSGEPWSAWLTSTWPSTHELVTGQWAVLLPGLAKVLLPVLMLFLVLGVAINLLQTGFLF